MPPVDPRPAPDTRRLGGALGRPSGTCWRLYHVEVENFSGVLIKLGGDALRASAPRRHREWIFAALQRL